MISDLFSHRQLMSLALFTLRQSSVQRFLLHCSVKMCVRVQPLAQVWCNSLSCDSLSCNSLSYSVVCYFIITFSLHRTTVYASSVAWFIFTFHCNFTERKVIVFRDNHASHLPSLTRDCQSDVLFNVIKWTTKCLFQTNFDSND